MLSRMLKKIRIGCGFTQKQIADVLGVDRSTYTYYEIGKTSPDIKTLIKMARMFNVDYVDFFLDCEKNVLEPGSYEDDLETYEKYDRKAETKIYDLSMDEKNLLVRYRVLSADDKLNFLNQMGEIAKATMRGKKMRVV